MYIEVATFIVPDFISKQHLLMKTSYRSPSTSFFSVLFSVLFLTSYESSYTAGLVNSKYGVEYNSLSGAIGENVTVCLFPQVNETLQFLYPSLRKILEVKDVTDMVNYIKDETCGARILHPLAFEAIYYEDNEICDDF